MANFQGFPALRIETQKPGLARASVKHGQFQEIPGSKLGEKIPPNFLTGLALVDSGISL